MLRFVAEHEIREKAVFFSKAADRAVEKFDVQDLTPNGMIRKGLLFKENEKVGELGVESRGGNT